MSRASKPLSEILDQSGRHRSGDQDLPVLSITMKHGLVDQADKFKKRVASSDTSNYRIAYKNELVVGFPIDEGVLGFQTKYPAGIVSPAYDIWRLKNEADCHIPYLERYLRSPQARSLYASRMQGAVARRRSLTKTDFLNLEVPFPPIDDQKRIAHLLGKVEGLIAQRKQHLQQLDDLLKSVFLEMFGIQDGKYKKWATEKLVLHAEIVSGVTKGKKYNNESLIEVPYMRVANVQDCHFILNEIKTIQVTQKEIDQYQLKSGDLLLTEGGDPDKLGRGSVWEGKVKNCIHQNHIFRVRVNNTSELNPYYLSGLVASIYGKAYFLKSAKQTTGIASINSTQLKNFPVIINHK
jgi:type I restriction enzyme S subunit